MKHKENNDNKVRFLKLDIQNRVLVRFFAKTGKCKYYDKQLKDLQLVVDIPDKDTAWYMVQRASSKARKVN